LGLSSFLAGEEMKDKLFRKIGIVGCGTCPNKACHVTFGGEKIGIFSGEYVYRCFLTGTRLYVTMPDDCPLEYEELANDEKQP
jgi:hypothetical protein